MDKFFTIIYTRRQVVVKWTGGARHYQRTERGRAAAQRKVDSLVQQGFTQQGEPLDVIGQIAAMIRADEEAKTNPQEGPVPEGVSRSEGTEEIIAREEGHVNPSDLLAVVASTAQALQEQDAYAQEVFNRLAKRVKISRWKMRQDRCRLLAEELGLCFDEEGE